MDRAILACMVRLWPDLPRNGPGGEAGDGPCFLPGIRKPDATELARGFHHEFLNWESFGRGASDIAVQTRLGLQKPLEIGRSFDGPAVASHEPIGEFGRQRIEDHCGAPARSIVIEYSLGTDRA